MAGKFDELTGPFPLRPENVTIVARGQTTEEGAMRHRALIVVVAALLAGVGAGASRAEQPPVDLAGQPFYFSATCTGLGDVILVNQSLSRTAALDVVGTNTVIIVTFGSIGGARGTEQQSNGTCTFTGGGLTPTSIEPFDEPFTAPVFVVTGSAA